MDKIKFENYKAFAKGEMELKPLTLLLGANSSGKSSILHLFLMLEQTINYAENYSTAFKTNGHSVSMGEDENLLKDKNHGKTLALEFDINANQYIKKLKLMLENMKLRVDISFLSYLETHFPKQFKKEFVNIEKKNKKRAKDESYLSIHMFNLQRKILFYGNRWKEGDMSLWAGISTFENLKNTYDAVFEFFTLFETECQKKVIKASIRYEFNYCESSKKINVKSCNIFLDDKSLINIITQQGNTKFESDVIKIDNSSYLYDFKFDFKGLCLSSTNNTQENFFIDFVSELFNYAYEQLNEYFSKRNLRYIGPLRANPQRYYFLDDSNTVQNIDSRNGASLAEILKKNKAVKEKINFWMSRFGLSVDVKEFKDVIHNIKVSQNGLLLDIPDVGFGISQVLPILVEGMIAPQQSTIIMEQPEIHLHPKMQAELADLFIDLTNMASKEKKGASKSLIIETHSEYILKRIRRRMAEGSIDPNQVAIYFVKPRSVDNPDSALLEQANIEKDGTIVWPEEFYITELEDELAFFNLKVKKS